MPCVCLPFTYGWGLHIIVPGTLSRWRMLSLCNTALRCVEHLSPKSVKWSNWLQCGLSGSSLRTFSAKIPAGDSRTPKTSNIFQQNIKILRISKASKWTHSPPEIPFKGQVVVIKVGDDGPMGQMTAEISLETWKPSFDKDLCRRDRNSGGYLSTTTYIYIYQSM